MSKTETIDEVFHVHKWQNTNHLLSISHLGDTGLEWLTDNRSIELQVRT